MLEVGFLWTCFGFSSGDVGKT